VADWPERRFPFPFDPRQLSQPRLLEVGLILLALLSLFRLLGRLLGQAPLQTGWTLVELVFIAFAVTVLVRSRLVARRLARELAGGLVLRLGRDRLRFTDRQGNLPSPSWGRVAGLPLAELSEVSFEQIQRVELIPAPGGGQRLVISFTPLRSAEGEGRARLVIAPPWPVEEIARELGERLGGDEPS